MRTFTRKSKYNAKVTYVDNIRFSSAREAHRYQELRMMEKGRAITHLVLQPKFPLTVGSMIVGTYIGDFQYSLPDGSLVVEDVKGVKTPMYRIKKKLVKAIHGIEIVEV